MNMKFAIILIVLKFCYVSKLFKIYVWNLRIPLFTKSAKYKPAKLSAANPYT